MRVVVAHGPNADVRERRQIIHAAGADCDSGDCVSWSDLPLRLGQQEADLVLVFVDDEGDVPWEAVEEASRLTTFPIFSVGDSADNQRKANEAGAMRHLSAANFRAEVDALAERHRTLRGNKDRGLLISVIAPLTGSGGSTVTTTSSAEEVPAESVTDAVTGEPVALTPGTTWVALAEPGRTAFVDPARAEELRAVLAG